jgi:hypothetical protein
MLVDVARQYKAGLIVVGTKGKQGAGAIVVGAVAEQLVRLAPCPVLAVAADYNAGEFRPVPGGPIMLAIEKNDATSAASATAGSLAQTFHRAVPGAVHCEGWQARGCRCRCDRAVPPQHACSGREAGERHARAPWNSLHSFGAVSRAGALCATGNSIHDHRGRSLCTCVGKLIRSSSREPVRNA